MENNISIEEKRNPVPEPENTAGSGGLDDATFGAIRDFVYRKCGITLGGGKKALVMARIRKRMSALRIQNPGEYFSHIMDDKTDMEIIMLIDSISTNVTSFFREDAHFKFLALEAAKWRSSGGNRFRLWSAACSSGEEPYSMAFVMKEAFEGTGADIKILGTDISTKVLGLAHQGIYDHQKAALIPEAYRQKYMETLPGRHGPDYRVKSVIREMVVINRLNLSVMPFPMNGSMDMIFCRNVMIYFDRGLRTKLVAEFNRLLRPGGYLVTGHTESLLGLNTDLKRVGPSIYMK